MLSKAYVVQIIYMRYISIASQFREDYFIYWQYIRPVI
jgi:hypothetical protein